VDVYSDAADEGRIYEGSTTADGSGAWTYSGPVTGPNITTTATDGDGNTSEFSAPFDPADTDGDGCSDTEELGPDPNKGGDRDPNNFWDFFELTGNKAIDLSDTLEVLDYFGAPGTSPVGNLRDRFIPDSDKPWRTDEGNNGVDLNDALANLKSFGHSCAAAP
jgi:hypothetical protein